MSSSLISSDTAATSTRGCSTRNDSSLSIVEAKIQTANPTAI
jgi:hypothetical protein